MFNAYIIETQIRETVKRLEELPVDYKNLDFANLLDQLFEVIKFNKINKNNL